MKTQLFVSTLILAMLFSGCRSTPDTQTAQPIPTSIEVPGITSKGVVITRFTGKALYYQKKCEACGFVSPQTIGTGVPETRFTCRVSFTCPKCGKTTEGFIKR